MMNLRTLSLLLLCTLLLAGCQLELPPLPLDNATPLNSPFTLRTGASIAVDGEPVTIRLQSWVEDKRCPTAMPCAESGPVRVQITLWREGKPMTYPVFTAYTEAAGAVLMDAPGSEVERKVGPYRITLMAVTPYPTDGQPLPLRDYAATFMISRDPTALPDTDADMAVLTEQPFILAPGELVTLVGRKVALRVAHVADARCPAAETGCTEGAVEVSLDWTEDGALPRQVRLSALTDASGATLPAAGTAQPLALIDGAAIRLLRVTPFPTAAGGIAQGDYRVTLMLEPGPRMPPGSVFAAPAATFSLPQNLTAVVGQDELRVRFDAVMADSRCPRQMLCVQAGTVQTAVTVAGRQQRATTYLLTGATDKQGQLFEPPAIVHDGYTLRLLQMTPYPEVAGAPAGADYIATFVVEAPLATDSTSAASAPLPDQPGAAAPTAQEAVLLPLLCINDFALVRMSIGGADEPAIRFTAPLTQTAATDYGQAHALCNKTFGAEWVQAGPSNMANFTPLLPEEQDFWIWDGMAGGLVRISHSSAPAP